MKSAKMLSKEPQELEINELVRWEIHETMPVTVEYSISGYGETLKMKPMGARAPKPDYG